MLGTDNNNATSVLWRRLRYQLSPQFDLYEQISTRAIGQRVLEVGFGTGIGVLQLSRAAEIVALELDADAVAFARRVFPLLNVTWLQADIADFLDPGTFDLITMIEVIEHVSDVEQALVNCVNLLKPGGAFFVTAPNAYRSRRKPEPLNNHEWAPLDLAHLLLQHFEHVDMLNWQLEPTADYRTNETPIICRCS